MNSDHQPFADELLTSWHARRSHFHRERGVAEAKPIRDRRGFWRHPDVHPVPGWIRAVSRQFDVPQAQLAAQAMLRRYPALSLDFLAWDRSPFPCGDPKNAAKTEAQHRLVEGIAWMVR